MLPKSKKVERRRKEEQRGDTDGDSGGGEGAKTGGEEEELEVGKPSNEKGSKATKMEGVKKKRKVEEEGNDRKYEKKSCNSVGNSSTDAIAITQTDPY